MIRFSVDADLFNFADDNNLSSVGHTMDEAKALLINETRQLQTRRKPMK